MGLQKNVGNQVVIFVMVDATDFATPETGISVTAEKSLDGNAFIACTNAVSEISAGAYKITLSQAETNVGVIMLKFTGAGCAAQFMVFYPDNDGSISARAQCIQTQIINFINSITHPAIKTVVDDIHTEVLAAATATQVADAVWDEAASGHTTASTFGKYLGGAPAGVTISADIAAIKAETALIVADTNELQTDDYPTSIAAVKADTAAILADTGTDGVIVAAASKTGYAISATGMDLVTCNVATVGATPTLLLNKIQALWNRAFKKKTVTAILESSYESDDVTAMETWTLADDDTTASRTI